ncbi:MAG TPA: hypothetical protein IAB84_00220 [Candidatus Choladousia intestinigallinarum]|nr:hypothetical protein [Candidatus Choladousia intestinigallinarum]
MENTKVFCNGCGRELDMGREIPQEEALLVEHTWGYFSEKDGERHSFTLCEACYDRIIRSFAIPVKVEEEL